MKTFAWLLTKRAPLSLYSALQRVHASADKKKLLKLLLSAESKGWIKLMGIAKGSPSDVAAVIQEHFDTKDIKLSSPKNKRGRNNGPKKRLE